MARIVAFIPDLLFGSRVHGALAAAGHQVELVSELRPQIEAEVLIVDLTAEPAPRIEQARAALARGVPGLAFYAHVEADVRARAEAAGFQLVVPRSRMARDAVALVSRLGSNMA